MDKPTIIKIQLQTLLCTKPLVNNEKGSNWQFIKKNQINNPYQKMNKSKSKQNMLKE